MFPVWEIGTFSSILSVVAELCEFKVTIFLIVSIVISDRPYTDCLLVFLAECLVLDQSAVCSLSLHEDLSVIEGDDGFGGLNGQDHDMQVSVQGRLKEHSQFWIEELKPSSFVRDIVTSGYRLPFLRYPDNVVKANHNSAVVHSEFVQEVIAELLGAGCVVECMSCPHVCSPLHVAVNAAGKKRLVVDFRYINQFLRVQKLSMKV